MNVAVDSAQIASMTPDSTKAMAASVVETPTSSWQYKEEEDKMTSKKIYGAYVNAKEELQFEFPYNGGSVATVYLRNRDGKTDIILMVSKGQFAHSIDGQAIRVRFDDQQPGTYNCSTSSDGDSKVLFITNVSKFLKNAKAANKMIIEAEFYNEGLRQMEFDIAGLEWTH
ncbi:hypothetical protein F0L74_30825 [Chitinophaga agrisoli]|uniref:Uncharacterized protein n=1 Tax=Chitinophaga agrisoli TaxID=2607653 RepID=A0A5B2VPB3_9BACT|nr:hypothetical protein [Chitinophaga agrisoli]KAA2240548.1 hypothetical protein F0L74_30825 [Chitinophaga agrisoli]